MITVVERGLCILFSYLVQVFFFGQLPSVLDVAGSAIIAVTVVLIGFREGLNDKTNDAPDSKECDPLLTAQDFKP